MVCIFSIFLLLIFISMVKSSQSTAKIEELLQEDGNVKRKREKVQKQSSVLSKLTRQLSIHDNRAAVATGSSNDSPAGNISVKLPVGLLISFYKFIQFYFFFFLFLFFHPKWLHIYLVVQLIRLTVAIY